MSRIYLVARRDYLAYVGAWGFWVSLIAAPVIMGVLMFGPVLLARAEPSRVLVILADRSTDAVLVTEFFRRDARRDARAEIRAYFAATAPSGEGEAMAAFDAAPNRAAAIAAARTVLARRAPQALRAFPDLAPRYLIAPPPAPTIEALEPMLSAQQAVDVDGARRKLYGALYIRRADNAPTIEYWSTSLSNLEPAEIAADALRLGMRRDALAARGLAPETADTLDALKPAVAQFDPREAAGTGAVTWRERAPLWAALFLSFVLWSVVFSAANMLLGGVVEERSNKILDTLLTSVSPLEILIGKLIAVAAVSTTLLLVWGGLGAWLLNVAASHAAGGVFAQIAAAFVEPHLIASFAIGFIAGYLLFGAIFLALGSLCESSQDAQTLLGPVSLVLALPLMLLAPALDNPNAPIVAAASWFPLFTPFLLIVRAPAGLPWLEIAGMAGVMLISVIVVLNLAARVFKAGVSNQVSLTSRRKAAGKA